MEKHICPNCQRKLRNVNAWHYCKQVDIDGLFERKSDAIVLMFDTILQQVADWEDVEVSATKNCIVFVRNKTFLVLKPMTKFLEVKFYSNSLIDDAILHRCGIWNSKFEGVARFEHEDQISPIFFQYFKNSYSIS